MDLFDIVISGKIRKEGGGDVSVDALNVTENGVYTAEEGHAYSPVTVAVPQPSGTLSITSNGVYDVGSFASADVNVSGGGGDVEDEIITRQLSGIYSNSRVSEVGMFAFYACNNVSEFYFDNATAFSASAFANCEGMTKISAPNLTNAVGALFYQCTKLKSVDFPLLARLSASAFYGCVALSYANLPELTYVGSQAFSNCQSLATINCPKVHGMGNSAFNGCYALTQISLPQISSIPQSAFYSCKSLMSIYLLSSQRVALGNVNALSVTPMSNSTYTGSFGSIYVPASLVSDYKAAANWSTYSDRITSYVEG